MAHFQTRMVSPQLEVRFAFELEWQEEGNKIGTKEFRKELKKRLEGVHG